jgi:hypothetical protein
VQSTSQINATHPHLHNGTGIGKTFASNNGSETKTAEVSDDGNVDRRRVTAAED